ncbi:MAG TPA: class I SAM-dependent methyltransferase [Candidatus Magasanikbacteria bacterium]|nr:class I SAM-dependent methyltransferase [Candidatus Magasanikbacteria bacterium]
MNPKIMVTEKTKDYELIDSGGGEKLERYGEVIFRRPDPQALWRKSLPIARWDGADAVFLREATRAEWQIRPGVSERWSMELGGIKFWIRPTAFKHTGLFPEQVGNWEWTRDVIAKRKKTGENVRVLNLFGYTGGATLAAASAGAEVVHVDGSKVAIGWARDNAELSSLSDKPIRWILDDAFAFVRREIRRGKKYEGIIMDPPAFGHGPEGESWKIEEDFVALVDSCTQLLSDSPLFVLINGYAAGYSSTAYENNLLPIAEKNGGEIEKGELAIRESATGRLLPCGIFARWCK